MRGEGFTVFVWCDERKGLVIPEDGKDDIADLVHDSADCGHLGFRFTLLRVVVLQYRILGTACAGGTNGLHSDDVDHPSGLARAALGEPDVRANKIAGLFHRRVQAKVGIELLGAAKGVEIADFTDQSDSAEESNAWNGLKQMDLFCKGLVRVGFENLFDQVQQLPSFRDQRADHTDKMTDEVAAAVHTVAKTGGVLRCRHQLAADFLRCRATASGSGGNYGNQLVPVRRANSFRGGIFLQQF